MNDCYIKVAKLKGEFIWHKHQFEDEMFMILQGQLIIEFKDQRIELNTGDIYVIPKGVEHNPIAKDECLVLLIENKSTLHTGNIINRNTKSIQKQLT